MLAVMGYGTVGSGILELFYKNKENIIKKAGKDTDIKYILDIREFPGSPYEDKFIKDISVILEDPEITAVAECMGGLQPAYSFVKACLEKGKSVCTSNKELVAAKGAQLLKIAKENKCNFFFEASVGGAIPVIRPLHRCLAANEITEITGILNGTTNYILTKMFNENMTFGSALELAQNLGYAEKDPTDDIDGSDACRKICILASLAFGRHVYPDTVYVKGIRGIDREDIKLAAEANCHIKLIAQAKKLNGGQLEISVQPRLIGYDNPMSQVSGVFNAVTVFGDAIDRVMFYGKGAGKLPTASAVIADLIEAVKHDRTVFSQDWDDTDGSFTVPYSETFAEMYYRVHGNSAAETVRNIFGSVRFIKENSPETAFITDQIRMSDAQLYKERLAERGIEVRAEYAVTGS
ncbi:MAG: homoserine dehydrogenase [Oscillospiraceae bacterium]|jgi:homoserine dehydrogenase|nr:homoserine dehydrogenase [Oscillospiraceae bacterium]